MPVLESSVGSESKPRSVAGDVAVCLRAFPGLRLNGAEGPPGASWWASRCREPRGCWQASVRLSTCHLSPIPLSSVPPSTCVSASLSTCHLPPSLVYPHLVPTCPRTRTHLYSQKLSPLRSVTGCNF